MHYEISTHDRLSTSSSEIIQHQLLSILNKEASALHHVIKNFPSEAHKVVELLLNVTGRVIFSGSGKSGIISKKLAATFSSLNIPALFLHPHDALHGDLGIVRPTDLLIIISKSGTGDELALLLASIKHLGIKTILISCGQGILNHMVDLAIVLPFEQEACSLNLAPTSSTTITLVFGDALAITTSTLKQITSRDFARVHPAGALGKKLLMTVESVMHPLTTLPLINNKSFFADFIPTITEKKLGVGIVVDDHFQLLGIITDGDIRRACKRGPAIFTNTATDIMTPNPKTINSDALASTALATMEHFNITSLVVTNPKRQITGLVHIHDIIKLGITK